MAYEELPKGRARITDLGSELRIEISLRPRDPGEWFALVLLTVWLLGWLAGEFFIGAELIELVKTPQPPHSGNFSPWGGVFLTGLLVAWTAGGCLSWSLWLRFLFGREIITVSADGLTVVTYPFGRPRKYRLSAIRNLRVREAPYEQTEGWNWFGTIAFDYGAKTVYFGSMLDPAEARQIVRLIKERFGDHMAPEE